MSGRIEFTFEGRLSAEEGKRSASFLAEALGVEPLHLVFDVRNMTGYDSDARVAWQNILFPKRKAILSTTMRGGNSIVRLGGTVLAMALGCPIDFV
jgi:hypothetical protein